MGKRKKGVEFRSTRSGCFVQIRNVGLREPGLRKWQPQRRLASQGAQIRQPHDEEWVGSGGNVADLMGGPVGQQARTL